MYSFYDDFSALKKKNQHSTQFTIINLVSINLFISESLFEDAFL